MWKELAIGEGKVLREPGVSIVGFIAEGMKQGGRFFITISWVEQSMP